MINHPFNILEFNQVGFLLKLIILLQFILNQKQKTGITWVIKKNLEKWREKILKVGIEKWKSKLIIKK